MKQMCNLLKRELEVGGEYDEWDEEKVFVQMRIQVLDFVSEPWIPRSWGHWISSPGGSRGCFGDDRAKA